MTSSIDVTVFLPLFLGLGLLAVTLCDSAEEIPFCPAVTRPKPLSAWSTEDIDQLLSKKLQPSDVAFSIAIWEHGNVAVPELEAKIAAMFEDALLTCCLELFILPSPITTQDPQSLPSPPPTLGRSTSNLETSGAYRRALVSLGDLETSLDFTETSPEKVVAAPGLPVKSRHDTMSISEGIAEALLEGEEEAAGIVTPDPSHTRQTWREKELEQRQQQAKIEQQQMAESGTHGQLTPKYSQHLIQILLQMHSSHSPSVRHWTGRLFTRYDATRLTASLANLIPKACWEFCTRTFQFSPAEDALKQVDYLEDNDQKVVVIGYCVRQWQEARQPLSEESHSNLPWMDPNTKRPVQLFHPLDSKKVVTKWEVPFQDMAAERTVFVPRQRLVVVLTNLKEVRIRKCTRLWGS